jgi:hypothetical protein
MYYIFETEDGNEDLFRGILADLTFLFFSFLCFLGTKYLSCMQVDLVRRLEWKFDTLHTLKDLIWKN